MTKKEFIIFLEEFRSDLEKNKDEWENPTLDSFLEAMIAYAKDSQNENEPTWQNFANILRGAAVYE